MWEVFTQWKQTRPALAVAATIDVPLTKASGDLGYHRRMTRPDWIPTDLGGLVAALIATGESCGVELACLPHLRAVAEELVTSKPSASVDPIMHDAWRPTLTGVISLVPVLIADTLVQANGPRLYGAMLVLLEAMTQTDPDAYEHARAILNDVGTLEDALRQMQESRRAREQAKIAASAAVPVAPALIAELDKIDRLVVEELRLSLPLPLWAELQTSRDARTVTYLATGELAHLGALYRAWAPGAGWLVEMVLDNDRYAAFELQREGTVIGVRLNPWLFGKIQIAIELPRPLKATVVLRERPKVVLKLPPITREPLPSLPADATPLDQPVALLADGGLLFVANEYDVWMIDPHARKRTLVASKQGVRMRALVPDGAGLLGMSSLPVTLHGIGRTDGAPIVVDDRAFGIACCRVGSTAFIGCDDGRILAVKLPTGEVIAEIAGFTKELRALTRADSMLYACDGRVISSIDPTTFKVIKIVELPTAASALASDGERLFTLHSSAIGAVDLAERTFSQVAGQPELGRAQLLVAGGVTARDGIGEGAVIEAARFLSHDAGNLWFIDGARLRWFEIRAMQTRTLELA